MSDKILWRKITPTDILAMTGEAAPAGTGGGAKHIALGVNSAGFPIHDFLGVTGCQNKPIKIEAVPGLVPPEILALSCQPSRRGGEWRISRQHHDRYPLWTQQYGFPENINAYDPNDPPVIFIIRISGEYHARFCKLSEVASISPTLDNRIRTSTKNSGVEDFRPEMGALFAHLIPPSEAETRVMRPTPPAPPAPGPALPPAPPLTASSVVTRYIRDSKYGRRLKTLYGYKCVFCEVMIPRPHDSPYVETCHIKPLNRGGPDQENNLLILCPNHHVEFDFGAITIDPRNMMLLHIDAANPMNGKRIQLRHQVDASYLDFHFKQWRKGSLMGY